jgi:hypothetical protein
VRYRVYSVTTYQIVHSIRQAVNQSAYGPTDVISLLQPAPDPYYVFYGIILIYDGRVVYHGPRDNVLEFHESMGFIRLRGRGMNRHSNLASDSGCYWFQSACVLKGRTYVSQVR